MTPCIPTAKHPTLQYRNGGLGNAQAPTSLSDNTGTNKRNTPTISARYRKSLLHQSTFKYGVETLRDLIFWTCPDTLRYRIPKICILRTAKGLFREQIRQRFGTVWDRSIPGSSILPMLREGYSSTLRYRIDVYYTRPNHILHTYIRTLRYRVRGTFFNNSVPYEKRFYIVRGKGGTP